MPVAWHRSFGMAQNQYLDATAWRVDVEVDVSLAQQHLDLVILRRLAQLAEPIWPSALRSSAACSSSKRSRRARRWTLKELAAHGVNDSHDSNFSSAVLDAHVRPRFLASSTFWLRGSSDPDSPVLARTRQALGRN